MKKMKTLTPTYKLATLSLVIAIFLSSCSSKMASLSNPNKLMHAQAIEKSKSPSQNTVAMLPEKTEAATATANAEPQPQAVVIKKEKTNTAAHIKHAGQAFAQTIKKETGKIITHQAAAFSQIGANHNTASIKSAQHTQGLLGVAIVLLILGVVFAALGFGGLGSLLWTIGIIILIIALVFFILYLLGDVAAS
jgi:PBP1b-binding outer membrane lipoprotein LpoB